MVYLVRHAHAGTQKRWPGPDHDRPLSARGQEQAHGLLETLRDYPVDRILTSPTLRCRGTVVPLGHDRGLPVEPVSSLDVRAPTKRLLELVVDPSLRASLLCGHGEQIRSLLRLLADNIHLDRPLRLEKGSWTWPRARKALPATCHRYEPGAWASSSCPQRLAKIACSGWRAHRPRGSGPRPAATPSGSLRRSGSCSVSP